MDVCSAFDYNCTCLPRLMWQAQNCLAARPSGERPHMRPMTEKHFAILRRHMVETIGIHSDLMEEEVGKASFDEQVLAAMLKVPRHLFVPEPLAHVAYEDAPLPIGFNQTISQPFISALMNDLLAPQPRDTVLEIGTGWVITQPFWPSLWHGCSVSKSSRNLPPRLKHAYITSAVAQSRFGSATGREVGRNMVHTTRSW